MDMHGTLTINFDGIIANTVSMKYHSRNALYKGIFMNYYVLLLLLLANNLQSSNPFKFPEAGKSMFDNRSFTASESVVPLLLAPVLDAAEQPQLVVPIERAKPAVVHQEQKKKEPVDRGPGGGKKWDRILQNKVNEIARHMGNGIYRCRICKGHSGLRRAIRNHIIHCHVTDYTPYTCPHCSEGFPSEFMIARHCRDQHGFKKDESA